MANLNINPLATDAQLLGSSPEISDLSRQRRIAEMLMAKGFQQPEGNMVSGRYVAPSWSQQLAPLLGAAIGIESDKNADTKQATMAAALRGEIAQNQATFQQGMANPETRAQTMQWAAGKRGLENITQEFMKPQKVGKGETIGMLGANGMIPLMEGQLDVPDTVQYAQIMAGLPKDPSTWTPEQRKMAEQVGIKKAQAGADQNRYDFGNMLGKSISPEVAKMLGESKAVALGAIQSADASNKILQAIDSNKMFNGSGANIKLGAAQLGQMIGITGEATKEKIANTRQAIQSLAQLTLAGRQQMRGQGAITMDEGKLATKAMSGEVDLTAGELRILANAAKRSGQFLYSQHESMLGALGAEAPKSVPFFTVQANPDIFSATARPAATIGQSQTGGNSSNVNNALSIIRGGNQGASQ